MGAGHTRLLAYLDVGPEVSESKLKKKYMKILTSATAPDKHELTWKCLNLDSSNVEVTAENLMEGANFIHEARINKENLLICIPPNDTDAVVFATSYFMILSGLPAEVSDAAIKNALKDTDLKLETTYEKSLQFLGKNATPMELRQKMFMNSGSLPFTQLSEDMHRIYELAGLPKPTIEQIKLEASHSTEDITNADNNLPPKLSPTPLSECQGTLNGTDNTQQQSTSSEEIISQVSAEESATQRAMHISTNSIETDNSVSANDHAVTYPSDEVVTNCVHDNSQALKQKEGSPNEQPQKRRSKVSIVKPVAESTIMSTVENVDKYLSSTTEEERRQSTHRISIVKRPSE